jgi:CcmD family protein
MAYLFSAFAVVWIGIFLYLHMLVRRSQILERQLADFLERSGDVSPRRSAAARGRVGTGGP